MLSRTKVVFPVKTGSFLAISRDVYGIIGGRQGVYVRAFVKSVEGSSVQGSVQGGSDVGRVDLRLCDMISVEAYTVKDAEAVVVSLKAALSEAALKVTVVVDLSKRGVSTSDYRGVMSRVIGEGGAMVRELCGKCSSFVRVNADSKTGQITVMASGKDAVKGGEEAVVLLDEIIQEYKDATEPIVGVTVVRGVGRSVIAQKRAEQRLAEHHRLLVNRKRGVLSKERGVEFSEVSYGEAESIIVKEKWGEGYVSCDEADAKDTTTNDKWVAEYAKCEEERVGDMVKEFAGSWSKPLVYKGDPVGSMDAE